MNGLDALEDNSKDSTKPKRKKTNRACNHCHKAHMTCDAGRPCKRCVQRGLDKTCEDAPRKRKKYLADVPNSSLAPTRLEHTTSEIHPIPVSNHRTYQATMFQHSATVPNLIQQPQEITPFPTSGPSTTQGFPPRPLQHPSQQPSIFGNSLPQFTHQQLQLPPQQQQQQQHHHQQQPYQQRTQPQQQFDQIPAPGKPRRTNFLSTAADLEYATLSNILQDSFGHHTTSNEGTPNSSNNFSPVISPHNMPNPGASSNGGSTKIGSPTDLSLHKMLGDSPSHNGVPSPLNPNEHHPHTSHHHHQKLNRPSSNSNIYDDLRYPKCDESINQYFIGRTEADHIAIFPDVITAIQNMKINDPAVYFERNSKLSLSFSIGIMPEDNHYNKLAKEQKADDVLFKEPEEIYEKVKKPFSYTPGYHSLIAYLRKRFPKHMLVKMAESMAVYRPSFIACTNSLKEGDLIFMEQCFQRTLLTYDTFIRISGTPTIVWRRTGEIAYVGNEFCILTGWTKEELVGGNQRRFIVELLDDKSVLEYFQVFSRIAFGDFLGATMTECTLLTPKKDIKIRTGCMWTLKRDVFGIPMMIVGNFLPIL